MTDVRICFHQNLSNISCCVDHGDVPACRQCADCGEWVSWDKMEVFVAEQEDPIDIIWEPQTYVLAKRFSSPYESVAAAFHEAYERLAPHYGYETRKESAVPWEQVPESNQRLMIAVVRDLMESGRIMAHWDPVHDDSLPVVDELRHRDLGPCPVCDA